MWLLRRTTVVSPNARLLCFPHAGGAAAMYLGWASYLRPDVELAAIELPGRGTRFHERPFTTFDALLDAAHAALLGAIDHRTVMFGHSLGAVIAFEVARRLELAGMSPLCLVVAGCPAPHRPKERRTVSDLSDADFAREIAALGGTPPEVLANAELMELMLPVLRADFAVSESYEFRAAAPLACPIVAMGGNADQEVHLDDVAAWKELTSSRFSCRVFPGGHFFVQRHARQIVGWIQDEALA